MKSVQKNTLSWSDDYFSTLYTRAVALSQYYSLSVLVSYIYEETLRESVLDVDSFCARAKTPNELSEVSQYTGYMITIAWSNIVLAHRFVYRERATQPTLGKTANGPMMLHPATQ